MIISIKNDDATLDKVSKILPDITEPKLRDLFNEIVITNNKQQEQQKFQAYSGNKFNHKSMVCFF